MELITAEVGKSLRPLPVTKILALHLALARHPHEADELQKRRHG